MELEELVEKLKQIGDNSMLEIFSDGSGLLNYNFTDRTRDTELAFSDLRHLEKILAKEKQNEKVHIQ